MKKLILLIPLFLISLIISAQTPFSMIASHPQGPASLSATSMDNPWVGAKLLYNVAGDVSNSFLLSGRAMYVIDKGDTWAIPAIANVGISNIDSLDEDSGVSIGVYPWKTIMRQYMKVINVHGAVNYHIAQLTDAGSMTDLRIMAGIEAAFYPKDGGMPATISAGPEYIINTGGSLPNTFGIQITGVLPIATGLGLLVESDVPLTKSTPSAGVKIGVILNNVIK
jgi:hypothetical protein